MKIVENQPRNLKKRRKAWRFPPKSFEPRQHLLYLKAPRRHSREHLLTQRPQQGHVLHVLGGGQQEPQGLLPPVARERQVRDVHPVLGGGPAPEDPDHQALPPGLGASEKEAFKVDLLHIYIYGYVCICVYKCVVKAVDDIYRPLEDPICTYVHDMINHLI